MDLAEIAWFMGRDVQPLPKFRKRVEQFAKECRCLKCGKVSKKRKRGRCPSCYYQFWKSRLETPAEKRDLYDKKLVRKGELASDRQGQGGGPKPRESVA